MSLPWVRLEASFPTNHKVLSLTDAGQYRAVAVYLCGLAYCGANETDGYVRRGALPFIHGRPQDAKWLVKVGLWQEFDEGWLVPDWSDYQSTKATNDGIKAAKRGAACKRWHPQPCPRC